MPLANGGPTDSGTDKVESTTGTELGGIQSEGPTIPEISTSEEKLLPGLETCGGGTTTASDQLSHFMLCLLNNF